MSRQKAGGRAERVAQAIKSELSELIAREVKDPRVKASFPAIGNVRINKDLNVAEIGVSFLIDDRSKVEAALRALAAVAGFLRGSLARRLNLPHAPELRFHHDQSQAMGMKLSSIVRDDAERRKVTDDVDVAADGDVNANVVDPDEDPTR